MNPFNPTSRHNEINGLRGNSRIPGVPRVIRPAAQVARQQFLKISEITYVDQNDPGTNFYGADAQAAINDDVTILKYAVVKFPQPLALAAAPYMLSIDALSSVQVTTWDYTSTPSRITFTVDIVPITSWGARTISDLTWNNYADLSLGSNLATGSILAEAESTGDTSGLSIYLGDLVGGTAAYGNTPDVRLGGFVMNQNPGQTVEGLVFIPGLSWSNVFRGATPINGEVNLTKPTLATSPTIDAFIFTNQ